MSVPQAATPIAHPYLRRLERLVRTLIRGRFEGAKSIWNLQLDLLQLQRDVQEAIGTTKKRARSDPDSRADLESLQEVRWHARRFGDAIAWLLLGLNRQLIYPLAQNEPHLATPDDHGSRGMIGIATALSNDGWRFPLLHDITDCLRIGDITFVKVEQDRQIQTVEIKARLLDERPAADGKTAFEYPVTVIPVPDEHLPTPMPDGEQTGRYLPPSSRQSSPEPSARVIRQVRRLHVARAHQEVQPGTLTEIDGKPAFSARATLTKPGHWKSLRRVVRRARAGGYASESVENTFLYVALYRPEGISVDSTQSQYPQIAQDLLNSGILFEENQGRNELVISSVPSPEERGPQLFLPYYLYSLPQTAIIDLLRGRLAIFVLVNSGRIVAALEEEGYEVTIPSGRNDFGNDSLVITTTVEDKAGRPYRIELRNLQFHVPETIYEFQSVQYLIEVAAAMRGAAKIAAERLSQSMFSPRREAT